MQQTECDRPPADPPQFPQGRARSGDEAETGHGQGIVEGPIREGQGIGPALDQGDAWVALPGKAQGRQVRVQPRHRQPAVGQGAAEVAGPATDVEHGFPGARAQQLV